MSHQIKSVESNQKITWRAAEYEHQERDVHWYWITGTIAGLVVLVSVKQDNYFFAVFAVLAALLLMINFKRKPAEYDFQLDQKGLKCGKHSYFPISEIHSFAIQEREKTLSFLIIRRTKKYSSYVKIPIYKELIRPIRNLLSAYAEEFEYNESIGETIADLLGL